MLRAVILTGPGFQGHDVIYCYYRFKEPGIDVKIATKDALAVKGKYGVPLPMDKRAKPNIAFTELAVENYDIVRARGARPRPPGPLRARLRARDGRRRQDRRRALPRALDHDLGAGHARVIDGPVVTDRNMITCDYYGSATSWCR